MNQSFRKVEQKNTKTVLIAVIQKALVKSPCASKKKKTKETIEAAQDLNALMKGIDSDLKKRKKIQKI